MNIYASNYCKINADMLFYKKTGYTNIIGVARNLLFG